MARIHARRKGRSGSSPQTRDKNPAWALKPKDVETKVVELSSEGNTTSQIGIVLRDMHGGPLYRSKEPMIGKAQLNTTSK